uniref:Uncharacterized protein n=1 Tax=Rhizophora mucronata TaxID=61149 RepID=A0A2P2INY3_RHIMU
MFDPLGVCLSFTGDLMIGFGSCFRDLR